MTGKFVEEANSSVADAQQLGWLGELTVSGSPDPINLPVIPAKAGTHVSIGQCSV